MKYKVITVSYHNLDLLPNEYKIDESNYTVRVKWWLHFSPRWIKHLITCFLLKRRYFSSMVQIECEVIL
ncbi:MAG: hypothetical protein GX638_00125 [Crenarchaeota archaeon]|nr:hypothetical protein [Thermoproteota archaeon]